MYFCMVVLMAIVIVIIIIIIIIIIILIIILTQEIGRCTTAVTGDPVETTHLFQCLSIAIQQTNAVSFTSTFKLSESHIQP